MGFRVKLLLAMWTIALPLTMLSVWRTWHAMLPGVQIGDVIASVIMWMVLLAFVRAIESIVFFDRKRRERAERARPRFAIWNIGKQGERRRCESSACALNGCMFPQACPNDP